MRQLPQDKTLEDVAAAQRRMVEGFLANGDPANPKFRRICYAASAEALKRYIRDRQDKLTPSEVATLKDLVVSSMTKAEETHGNDGQLRQFINTVLDEQGPTNRAQPPVSESSDASIAGRDDAASLPGKKSWRAPAIGFFIGSTLVLLGLQLLQAFNVVYIHHQPEGFQQLKQLNQAMADAKPAMNEAIKALHEVQAQLNSALSRGDIKKEKNPEFWSKFNHVNNVLPEFYKTTRTITPGVSSIIIRLGENGGYKILMSSYMCIAFSFFHPEMVDPVRTPGNVMCNYFGIWNDMGGRL